MKRIFVNMQSAMSKRTKRPPPPLLETIDDEILDAMNDAEYTILVKEYEEYMRTYWFGSTMRVRRRKTPAERASEQEFVQKSNGYLTCYVCGMFNRSEDTAQMVASSDEERFKCDDCKRSVDP